MAKIFLESNDTFTQSSTNTGDTIFGGTGSETVILQGNPDGTLLDGNVEEVQVAGNAADTTLQVNAQGQLELSSGGTVYATFTAGLNAAVDLQFEDGNVTLKNTAGGVFTVEDPADDTDSATIDANTAQTGDAVTLGSDDSTAGDGSGGGAAQTFTLTDGIDFGADFTGGAGDDTFVVTSAVDDAGDALVGGGGKDTLYGTLNANLAPIDATEIEVVNIHATANITVDMDYVEDATSFINRGSSGVLEIDNFENLTELTIEEASADTTLGSSSATAQSLTVNVSGVEDADDADLNITAANTDVTSLTMNVTTASSFADMLIDEVETLTIDATEAFEAEEISEAAALTDIVMSGAGDVTLLDVTDATTLDTITSTGSGAVSIEALNTADMTISTGSGDDRIGVTDGQLNADDSIDLGEGNNTLAIGVAAGDTFTMTSAIANVLTNVDVLELATQDGAAGADTVTLDTTSAFNTFAVGVMNDGSDADDDVYNIDSVASGATVNVAESIAELDVDLETAGGASDVFNLNIGGTAAITVDTILDVDDFETVNIAVSGDNTVTIDDVDADAADNITITGALATDGTSLVFTDISDVTTDTVIDASAFDGDVTISEMREVIDEYRGATGTNDITTAAGAVAQGNTFSAQAATDDVLTTTATQDQDAGILAVTGFETIEITSEDGNNDDFTADFRNVTDLATVDLSGGDAADDFTLDRLSSDVTVDVEDDIASLTMSLQTGSSHTVAAGGGAADITGTLTLDAAATALALDSSDQTLDIGTIAGGSLETITATGDNAMTIDNAVAASVTSVDASAMTAAFTVTANDNGVTVVGGSGDDVITGGTGDDTITGGDGQDDIDVTGGDNTIIYTEATDSQDGSVDAITNFGADDVIDLSAFGFTGDAIAAILDAGAVGNNAGNDERTATNADNADLFDDGGTDRAVYVEFDTDMNNNNDDAARIFVDVNGNGDYDVANDLVIDLVGVNTDDIDAITDFIFA